MLPMVERKRLLLMNWKNKVVIVTGSSKGIGKALASQLLQHGARVVLNARNAHKLQMVHKELSRYGERSILAIAGDVSKPLDCKKIADETIAHYGQIDILINNAGVTSEQSPLEDTSEETFRKIVDINLLGCIFMTKAVLPSIKENRGAIFFVGSVAGIHGLGGFSGYSSTKMALTGLAQSLRKELAHAKVYVGLAYVGFTENEEDKTVYDQDGKLVPISDRGVGKKDTPDKVAAQIIKMIERRKAVSVFSLLGKINAIMNRLAPGIVHKVLQNAYNKRVDSNK